MDNLSDIRNKPHIEHTIGFIDHQNFNFVEMQNFLSLKIKQTARRRHHDVNGVFYQHLLLFIILHTAQDGLNSKT